MTSNAFSFITCVWRGCKLFYTNKIYILLPNTIRQLYIELDDRLQISQNVLNIYNNKKGRYELRYLDITVRNAFK